MENAWIFLFLFVVLSIQMLLTWMQVRHYQRMVRSMRGSGVLGIGQRKSWLRAGEIVILSYSKREDRVVSCMSMKGFTIFAKFKELPPYTGLTLAEIRKIAIVLDAREMGRYRKRHPYDATVLSKKKGALIQAVEALELRFRNEAAQESAYETPQESPPSRAQAGVA